MSEGIPGPVTLRLINGPFDGHERPFEYAQVDYHERDATLGKDAHYVLNIPTRTYRFAHYEEPGRSCPGRPDFDALLPGGVTT